MDNSGTNPVRRVLLITLLLNLMVALGKIILGTLTGVIAVTADGFHSLTDGAGNIAGLIAIHFANRPPDDEHPYGHHRIETMASLIIGALLLMTAWELANGIVERIREAISPEVHPVIFIVLIITLVVNFFVSRYQIREGERLQSQILLADAQNTSADLYVTASVLLSTAAMMIWGWWWVDVIAALVVVVLVAHAAWGIIRDSSGVLMDRAPYAPDQLRDIVGGLPAVERVNRVRSRGVIGSSQIDVDVEVARETTAEQSASIARSITQQLQSELGASNEVTVTFVPRQDGQLNYALAARAAADALGLATHDVQVTHQPDGKVLEMHVEVPPGQTLVQAHEQVSQLESDLRDALPDIDRVETHIEPANHEVSVPADSDQARKSRQLASWAEALLHEQFPDVDWHDLSVLPLNAQDYCLMVHATLPQHITIDAAHRIAEQAEVQLRAAMPAIMRVTVHTEPCDH